MAPALDEESKEAIRHACWCCQCACGGLPKLTLSYAPPKDVLGNSTWCCYCLCGGCGWGPIASPLVGLAYKYGCCKNTCESADCLGFVTGEGICGTTHRCLCCTYQCQCPKTSGPCCQCCGANAGSCKDDCLKELWEVWTCHLVCCRPDPWWCIYTYCCGCGIHEVMQDRSYYFQFNQVYASEVYHGIRFPDG